MKIDKFTIAASMLMVTSCSGGGGGSDPAPTPSSNVRPNLSASFDLVDSSGDDVIEHEESFALLISVSDADGDSIQGTATLNGEEVAIASYTGGDGFTHQATFDAPEFGEYEISVSVTDSRSTAVTGSFSVGIVPNESDIADELASVKSEFVPGGNYEGTDLIGISVNEDDSNIGYINGSVPEDLIAQNDAPAGECGMSVPHKLLGVEVSTSGISIPEDGLIFPLECVTESQAQKMQAKAAASALQKSGGSSAAEFKPEEHYVAQRVVVTRELTASGEVFSSTYTGSGIQLEGNIQDVYCGDFELDVVSETATLNADKLIADLSQFGNGDDLTLSCERRVTFEGDEKISPLLGQIEAELVEVDSLAPTGSIQSVNFTVPFNGGGLDVGEVCVATNASDESGIFDEEVTLESSDGLSDEIPFGSADDAGERCLSLEGLEGDYNVKQVITDNSTNSITNRSSTFPVVPNQAPVFGAEVPDTVTFKRNQGIVTLVTVEQISDPEGHDFSLSGDTTIDTSEPAGEYERIVSAEDEYGARSSKTITVQLEDNVPPTAAPSADAGTDMSVDTGTTIQLDGTGSFDPEGDPLTYTWTVESRPFFSRAELSDRTAASPTITVDEAGSYEISLIVSDGESSSLPSSIFIEANEAVHPLSNNINLLISAGGSRFYGFSGQNNQEVLQSTSSRCLATAMDMAPSGVVKSSAYDGSGLQEVDAEQPLCLKVGEQPADSRGIAVSGDGTLWVTSDFLSSPSNSQFTRLFHVEQDGTVISQVEISGSTDQVFGIDFGPDGELYGVEAKTSSHQLVRINLQTGVTTVVGELEGTSRDLIFDIDIDQNGILRFFDDETIPGTLREHDLTGSLLRSVELPSVCRSCGFVGIVTNTSDE